jgi:dTDP-4-dehydrorhamnose 3,5-epimerase
MPPCKLYEFNKLGIVPSQKGAVLHIMKDSDSTFKGFGEAYFSTVRPKEIKAWKLHTKMVCNLVVPIGEVHFVLFTEYLGKLRFLYETKLSKENYARLTIFPNVWFGFQNPTLEESLILNIANIKHDPLEEQRKNLDEIYYNWGNIK